jgi:C1A family cysteine protease
MGSLGGLGWVPEPPEIGDYGPDSEPVAAILRDVPTFGKPLRDLPAATDLVPWCSPVEDQGNLSSCTAHAAIGLLEYLQRRFFRHHLDLSRLFLYKVTRDMLRWRGDQGAYLRTAMLAVREKGAPPEKDWPYDEERFDEEPGKAVYDCAECYKTHLQYRLDTAGAGPRDVLELVRRHLAAGVVVAFGFTPYASMPGIGEGKGDVPMPTDGEEARKDGHALVAVGYDRHRRIPDANGRRTTGALKVRNSWGTRWGTGGYGWLPFEYVRKGLCADFWTMTEPGFARSRLYKGNY